MLSVNPIVAENQLSGTPQSVWDIQYSAGGAGDPTIQGYATDISVNHGQTVSFKINDTQNAPYHIDIYRMGYYQGNGARLVGQISSAQTIDKVQPNPLTDATTGLVDAGNWSVTASWAVPANAVSGIYFAHVVRNDTGGDFHIPFIVRDDNDSTASDILFQTDDTTWEAYNEWGGQSLYKSNTQAVGRAYKVSYNRPFETRTTAAVNWMFSGEYPMVRWLEANGYSVSYFTGMDADRFGSQITQHKLYLTAGHDEYWSGQQMANVEAALAGGVNMAFLTGNDIFWKTRWENSTDGSNTPYRTLVSYKETYGEQKIDPAPVWTGTWRDPTLSPPYDARPENALTGTLFVANGNQGDQNSYNQIQVPAQFAGLRFWRNTAVAALHAGQTYTLPPGTLGFEWNLVPDNGYEPPGSIDLSSTTLDVSPNYLLNYGTIFGNGTATHSLHLYRDQNSRALVFSAGTVDYAWALDNNHDFNGVMSVPDMGDVSDVNVQQATVNLFADMGVQPVSLRPGLVQATASTDATPPQSVITSPAGGTNFLTGTPVAISGTATDAGGGVVAGVEVSLDGGVSWHPASIASAAASTTWSFAWTPAVPGTVVIKTRAVDDSGNLETPSAGVSVTVVSQGISLFSPATKPKVLSSDSQGIEVGVKFTSSTGGQVSGIRYYRAGTNTNTHTVHLWSSTGQLLASGISTNEVGVGWVQVNFAAPVTITANTSYVASYFTPVGQYAADAGYFAAAGVTSGPLQAPSGPSSGGNGVYAYSASSTFPNQSYSNTNYWVDVVLTNPNTTNPIIYSVGPAPGASLVAATTRVTVTFNKALDPATVTAGTIFLSGPAGNAIAAAVSYDANTHTAFLTPNSPLGAAVNYTLTVLGGASGPVVKDTSGNPLAASFTSSFFTAGPAPVVQSTTPASAATGVANSTTVSVTFNHAMDASTITASTLLLKDANGKALFGTVSYDPASYTATITTRSFLLTSATYTATVVGGSGATAVKDLNGTALAASYSWSFTTAAQGAVYPYIFRPTAVPQTASAGGAGGPLNVGVRFTSSSAGVITGIRFYKGSLNTGTHVGSLWSATGQLLATATFTVETASGWQQVNFTSPVVIQANTTYVASYFSASGYFAQDQGFFATQGVDGSPLHSPADSGGGSNGLYAYAASTAFPNQTYNSSNYWVDVAFQLVPFVASVSPASGAGQVNAATPVTVTFSEAMDPTTITTGIFVLKDAGGNAVAASVSYNAATLTATLTPSAPLAADTFYTASVLGGAGPAVKDQYGNALLSTFTWTFLTDGPPPVVNAVTPAAGATGVNTTAGVTVTFSEAMDPTTVNTGTLQLKDAGGNAVPASVVYDPTSHTATLTPMGLFTTSTNYTATVLGGAGAAVKDVNGKPLAASYSWSFTTSAQPTAYPSLWRPSAAPQVFSPDTSSLELGVKFYSTAAGYITGIRFYKAAGSTGTHVGNLWSSTGQLLATATFTGETASGWQQVIFSGPVAIAANATYVASYFAPAGHYADDQNYFNTTGQDGYPLHAPSSAASGGNGIYSYGATSTFPNQSYSGSNYWVDVVFAVAPAVTSVSPAPGAGQVNPAAPVTVTFSEAVDPTTVNASTFLLKDAGGNVVAASVSYNANTFTATLTPSAALAPDAVYTASVLGGSGGPAVKDLSGNAVTATYIWSFTADGPAPAVSSSTPAARTTGVSTTTAAVTVVFSHAMNPTTINAATLLLKDSGGNAVPVAVSYDPTTFTATLTTAGFFAPLTTYTVTIAGGAGAAVQDVNGKPLAATYSSSFTTSAQPAFYPSLWRPAAAPQAISTDSNSVELGVKFYSTVAGSITGIRFYKGMGNTGTHIGHLWSSTGQLLATATFTSETASGWQQVSFSSPVAIAANITYVASYFAPAGHYAVDQNYFAAAGWDSSVLHAPSSAASGGNGVYAYGMGSAFPNQSFAGSNYWVDVVFNVPIGVVAATPAAGATGVSTAAAVSVMFDRAMDPTTVNSTTIFLKDSSGNVVSATVSYDAVTNTAWLIPTAPLKANTTYTLWLLGGVSGPRLADVFGDFLSANDLWSFTTGN